jgi:diguanylate cyclase (GGDEF)-like protein
MLDGDGARIGGKIGDWPHMAAFAAVTEQGGSAALPATLHFDDRHLSVEVLPIEKPLGRDLAALGHVIVLNDTTELRRNNLQLTAALATNERRLQEITRLRDDLERQIILDPLTGVHNRRGLDATFDALAGQAPAGESDLILALLDIDHFKAINDNHGHDVGDRVLRDFARMLRARVNAQLPVFRVGGEEFVIMFPRTDFATIDAQLARFRRDLVNSLFTRIADPVQISFSAGLASRPQDGTTFSAVFKRADDRLYAAKMAGRGCTRFTDAPDQNNAQKGA